LWRRPRPKLGCGAKERRKRCKSSIIFRNKKRKYPREKIMGLKQTVRTKISDLRVGINEFQNF
jgi:hypothetical protein